MDREQRKRPEHAGDEAKMISRGKRAGRGASSKAPAQEGPTAVRGGEKEPGSSWEADADLMSAMGIGPDDAGDEAEPMDESSASEAAAEKPAPDSAERGPVQHRAGGAAAIHSDGVHQIAGEGIAGSGGALPHLDAIQASFGRHDVSSVQAHTDGAATEANAAMGAEAYATGNHVAFGSSSPSLHTAAHEAAHVVQQRGGVQLKGGVGEAGDIYERHADAVADRVVQGERAVDLLDQMAGGGDRGGVQHQAIQMDVKADLRDAFSFLVGADGGAIRERLGRATPEELKEVLGDVKLMSQLRRRLGRREMTGVLDLLGAPLIDKLRLALGGWGVDDAYIFRAVEGAPADQVVALVDARELVAQIDRELKGELTRWRGLLARRLHVDAGDASRAYAMCVGPDRQARLDAMGDAAMQLRLYDALITSSSELAQVRDAFELYWSVKIGLELGEKGETPSGWTVPVLQSIHTQLKHLPEGHTRTGVWNSLTQKGGSNDGGITTGGDMQLGDEVNELSVASYGVGTTLSKLAARGATEIHVRDTSTIAAGSSVEISRETVQIVAVDATNLTCQLAAPLKQPYMKGERVKPDVGAVGIRRVGWLDALVRHEIAHSVDLKLGGVPGFTEGLGGWWSGDDFEHWANQMGAPWTTNDGSVINDDEKSQIRAHLCAVKNTPGMQELKEGLDAAHPIVKYYDKDVPVIEAAKHPARTGRTFFTDPTKVRSYAGKRFSVNHHYHKFQFHNEQVASSRVRDYQIFAPAEFFAETYTVYYEEAGRVPDADLGRLVPVPEWRQWITDNIHNRGLAPSVGGGSGSSPGDGGGSTAAGGTAGKGT